jgi:MFS family permease
MIDNVGLRCRFSGFRRPYCLRVTAVSAPSSTPDTTMTPLERRSSASLALIFALRMLGLFLVLPVFALEARKYPGGDDAALVGMAMGIYGLTQGILQIPFGVASDKFGRKPVMVAGLLIFALGSAIAAWAPTLGWLVAGRAIQGAGAISAAVTAMLADQTRDVVRTKAMALVGASIGLMFALSLVLSPLLAAHIGLHGLFALTSALALGGIAVVVWWVPPEPAQQVDQARGGVLSVLRHPALLRLDFGVFVLHAVQLSMWVALPAMLVQAGLPRELHWEVYLPAVLVSFVVMGATLFPLEKKGYLRAVFLTAIGLVGLVQLALWMLLRSEPHVVPIALVLFVFFCGFNVLEASQPSLASRAAPASSRGAALGVYNTLQSLGFFAGGALGGWLVKSAGAQALYLCSAIAMLAWLAVAWGMEAPAPKLAPKAG